MLAFNNLVLLIILIWVCVYSIVNRICKSIDNRSMSNAIEKIGMDGLKKYISEKENKDGR
jgi:hypothetical protein